MSPHKDTKDIPLDEMVMLIMPGEKPAAMTVTKAVGRVMGWKDEIVRTKAWLTREENDSLNYEDICAIYARADFSN